jgi:hypothetical protein
MSYQERLRDRILAALGIASHCTLRPEMTRLDGAVDPVVAALGNP